MGLVALINTIESGVSDLGVLASAAELTPEALDASVRDQFKVVHRLTDRVLAELLSPAELLALKEFSASLKPLEFARTSIEELSRSSSLTMRYPLGPGMGTMAGSIMVRNVNFVRFTGCARSFYVLQHVSSIDGIFFPTAKLLFVFKHVAIEHIIDFIALMLERRKSIAEYFRRSSYRFLGYHVSHGRPYHFFYDIAPATLFLRGMLRGKQKLIHSEGDRFAPVARCLGLKVREETLSLAKIRAETVDKGGMYFRVGARFSKASVPLIEEFDALLMHEAAAQLKPKFRREVDAFCGGASVIWVGITAQKRIWAGQTDELARVLNTLARAGDIRVVVDGWTCGIDGAVQRDEVQIASDNKVMSALVSALDPAIRTLSSIGLNPLQKIYIARQIEFFITNHSTGSIYVSRFARKPGVTHSSRAMPAEGHIHARVVRVNSAAVTDAISDPPRRFDLVDYDIAPGAVETAVRQMQDLYLKPRSVADARTPAAAAIIAPADLQSLRAADAATLHNDGFLSINAPESWPAERTLIVLGVARSGTSMIAGALQALGVRMNEGSHPVFEDVALSEAVEVNDMVTVQRLIAERNARFPIWGWKRPSSLYHIGRVEKLFRNPEYVVVFRDLFAIANRNRISAFSDVQQNMRKALREYNLLLKFLESTQKPILLVSYEKAMSDKEGFAAKLARHISNRETELLQKAAAFIEPNPVDYLLASRVRKSLGQLGGVNPSIIEGWAFMPDQTEPVEVLIQVNGREYARVVADRLRQDVLRQKLHPTGRCGFRISVPRAHALKTGDLVSARVIGDNRDLARSPKQVA